MTLVRTKGVQEGRDWESASGNRDHGVTDNPRLPPPSRMYPCQDRHCQHSCRLFLALSAVRDCGIHPRPSGPLRAPARCIFLRGLATGIGRESPLRKMTSAAYGAGNHPVANALAAGVPLFPFSATSPLSNRLPGENGKRAAPPDWAGTGIRPYDPPLFRSTISRGHTRPGQPISENQ